MGAQINAGYTVGCIGRIVQLHADFYSSLVGFGLPFEAKVARELTQFCECFDAKRDGLWLATMNGVVHGSIAIDGSHADRDGVHLRWFITSDELRGRGLGSKLIREALDFCDRKGYKRVYLWTFDGLGAARHLYERLGFVLVHEQVGTMWGGEVLEQRFERICDALVNEAKRFTDNLSGTIEGLMAQFVQTKRQEQVSRQEAASRIAQGWNAVLEKHGSFADEHSTL